MIIVRCTILRLMPSTTTMAILSWAEATPLLKLVLFWYPHRLNHHEAPPTKIRKVKRMCTLLPLRENSLRRPQKYVSELIRV
ncbi:hypothetical protein MUK42_20046 [Musa troglodytarum]|uniref:Uncharacterized protein n=1 Tax=Musa troglodytarum TaxID=320322 RepID=A0A9E7ENP5_9LILI|nr:hypothetical protein MUK42_20046 [Musa troglodytarum]